MRTLIICLSLILTSVILKAEELRGISIDGGDDYIIVYLDGKQISKSTNSCYIANLLTGKHNILVYLSKRGKDYKGRCIYNDDVMYQGRFINIDVSDGNDFGNVPEASYHRVMPDRVFDQFYTDFRLENFYSDRKEMVENALITSSFTSLQCKSLVSLLTFDSEKQEMMKMLYPAVVDKQSFFMVIDTLDFDSRKREIYDFIEEYNARYY